MKHSAPLTLKKERLLTIALVVVLVLASVALIVTLAEFSRPEDVFETTTTIPAP